MPLRCSVCDSLLFSCQRTYVRLLASLSVLDIAYLLPVISHTARGTTNKENNVSEQRALMHKSSNHAVMWLACLSVCIRRGGGRIWHTLCLRAADVDDLYSCRPETTVQLHHVVECSPSQSVASLSTLLL
jgi:hypothetical protein